ncbi:MAG TPA: twin-arginine translocase subunit TatC [Syntrophobacteria bacterium]|nr:twin-arginine translocase subunit TatC [Syntrophobacteria bacterium]
MTDNEEKGIPLITRSVQRIRENPAAVAALLESFRKSLIRIAVAVVACSLAGYVFARPILTYFYKVANLELAAYGIPEAFLSLLNVALATGIFASIPYITYEILAALPPLFPSFTRRMMLGFWLVSLLLFYAGALFCRYVTLPYGVRFLLSFEGQDIEAIISVSKFVSFCMLFVFGFGLIFELPLAMILVGRLGLVSAKKLGGYRRYAILLISIVAAVLTPTPDVFNMMLMAVPLYVLFELGLLGMRVWGK